MDTSKCLVQFGEFSHEKNINYDLKSTKNGVYAFIIEGKATIQNHLLSKRDGLGIWDTKKLDIKVHKGTKVLLMEVPMVV